jgi:hypothetical protein
MILIAEKRAFSSDPLDLYQYIWCIFIDLYQYIRFVFKPFNLDCDQHIRILKTIISEKDLGYKLFSTDV